MNMFADLVPTAQHTAVPQPATAPLASPAAPGVAPRAHTAAARIAARRGATGTNALSPTSALNNFANSAGMQFQLQQGSDAIQNRYAAHGALQSGAAMKALSDYAQGTALNNYFMPYMSLLGGQQAVGAQAGSAVAGVGSSFGNAATGINSNLGNATTNINGQMGGAIQNGANAAAQGAYVNGAANVGLGNTIGSALGQFGSSFFRPNAGSGLGQSLYPVVNGVDPLAPLP